MAELINGDESVRKALVSQEDTGVVGRGTGKEIGEETAGEGAVSRWVVLPLLPAETPTQHAGTAGSLVGNAIYAQIRAIGIMEVHSEDICYPSLGWNWDPCWHSVYPTMSLGSSRSVLTVPLPPPNLHGYCLILFGFLRVAGTKEITWMMLS